MNKNIINEGALAKESSSNLKSYWDQWGLAEIASLHGFTINENKEIIEMQEYHKIPEGEPEHYCSGCMDCLGLSWADFI